MKPESLLSGNALEWAVLGLAARGWGAAFPAAASATPTQPLQRLQSSHWNICSGFRGIIPINRVRRVSAKAKNPRWNVWQPECVPRAGNSGRRARGTVSSSGATETPTPAAAALSEPGLGREFPGQGEQRKPPADPRAGRAEHTSSRSLFCLEGSCPAARRSPLLQRAAPPGCGGTKSRVCCTCRAPRWEPVPVNKSVSWDLLCAAEKAGNDRGVCRQPWLRGKEQEGAQGEPQRGGVRHRFHWVNRAFCVLYPQFLKVGGFEISLENYWVVVDLFFFFK